MRFAITTVDRYLGVFEAFCQAGWTPLKLFTVPVRDPEHGNQRAVIALAESKGAAIQLSRIAQKDLADLGVNGCDVLLVASYDWRVPDWHLLVKYAINFHPAPLPVGRGPYPVPRAILESRPSWAVTCHRLTAQIDAGEILATETFRLRAAECHESLDLRLQMAAKRLAGRVARNFVELWQGATPQGDGSYWPRITMPDRVVDFTRRVDDLLQHVRAYGRTGSVANVNGTWLIVKRAVGWQDTHNAAPGTVVHIHERTIVIAVADGYLALLESSVAPPHVSREVGAAHKNS